MNFYLKGGNGLSFTGGDVYFWTSVRSSTWNTGAKKDWGRIVYIQTPITQSAYGVYTFAGNAGDTREYPTYDISGDYIKWNGQTYIVGARLSLSSGKASFKHEVHVLGGTLLTAGQLQLGTEGGTINHKVHLAGEGPSGAGAVHNTGSCSWTFAGGTALEDDTYITHDNAPCGTIFRGAVSGAGRLALGLGHFDFHAAGSNVGGMELRSDNTVLNVHTNGTLGTGPVVAQDGVAATVNFYGQYRVAQPSVWVPEGTINIVDSRISLDGFKAKTVNMQGGIVDATVSDDVAFGQLARAGIVRLTAGADSVTVSAGGDGDDFVFDGELNDGEGAMGFAKTGSNAVTFYRAGTSSGPLAVKGGTLKLTDDLTAMPALSWWLDAAAESTISRDDEGRVTEWRSANGNDVVFTPSVFGENTCPAPTYTAVDAKDGLPGVSFSGGQTNSLAANVKTDQRMVILAVRPAASQIQWTSGVFGRLNSDYGQRYTSAAYWNPDDAKASFHSGFPKVRLNGVEVNYNIKFAEELHLAVFVHDDEHDTASASVTGNPNFNAERFVPAIGGYFNPFGGSEEPRFFTGEICEVMAFGRILSADELSRVENYLSEKWLKRTVHAAVPPYDVLRGASVSVDEGATLEIDCPVTIHIGESGIVNPIAGAGKVKLGSNAALNVVADCDVSLIPKTAYTLISAADGVEGTFKSVVLPRRLWHVETDATSVVVDTSSGLCVIVR